MSQTCSVASSVGSTLSRVPELDGIRGVAIILVLVWHYFCDQIKVASPHPLYFLARAFGLSWSGVDLFFVLSGFLIGGILLDQREAANYFRVFYIRRICRIFPLYYAMLALFFVGLAFGMPQQAVMAPLFQGDLPCWSYAVYLQNVFMGWQATLGAQFLAVTWSLAVEEQFYLMLPLVVYLAPRTILPWLLYGLILMALVLRGLFLSPYLGLNLPFRLDALICGALLAYAVRQPGFMETIRARLRWLYGVFGLLLFGTAWITVAGCAYRNILYFWLALLYTTFLMVVLANPQGWVARNMRWPILRWFGLLSYGIYILHQCIAWGMHSYFRGERPAMRETGDAWLTLLALGLTLALASISYYGFEKRILSFGRSFHYRAQGCPPTAG